MSHTEQQEYVDSVKNIFKDKFINKKVLEVGSLDLNGSVRDHFEGCDYLGIDVGEGKGVDMVIGGQDYDAPTGTYDTVISCECFEHNPYWLETFINMHRMCRVGGLVIMTCATTGREEHGTTRTTPEDSPFTVNWDYYKNLTEKDFTDRIDMSNLFVAPHFSTRGWDLQFYGIKK